MSWPAAPATKFSSSPSLLTSTTRRCRPPPLSPAMQAARGEHSLSIATRDAEASRKVLLLPSARSRPKPGQASAIRASAFPAHQEVAVHGRRGRGRICGTLSSAASNASIAGFDFLPRRLPANMGTTSPLRHSNRRSGSGSSNSRERSPSSLLQAAPRSTTSRRRTGRQVTSSPTTPRRRRLSSAEAGGVQPVCSTRSIRRITMW